MLREAGLICRVKKRQKIQLLLLAPMTTHYCKGIVVGHGVANSPLRNEFGDVYAQFILL